MYIVYIWLISISVAYNKVMGMPRYRPETEKSLMHISYYVGRELHTEYIPRRTSRFGFCAFQLYRRVLNKFGVPHYYIHYRHLYSGPTRKAEDFRFLMHVIADHDEQPEDHYERRHFERILALYEPEFSALIRPIIGKDYKKAGVADNYIRAYYRNWLTKQTSPDLRRLYHGVEGYEMVELLPKLYRNSDTHRSRVLKRINYHQKRAKS